MGRGLVGFGLRHQDVLRRGDLHPSGEGTPIGAEAGIGSEEYVEAGGECLVHLVVVLTYSLPEIASVFAEPSGYRSETGKSRPLPDLFPYLLFHM